ncbi:MAG: glycosyltransferase [Candidatus Riflebacteria bacterium]|nr:glycosyltransferase [Candidatus Riflebacteria bacterium]
MENHVPFRLSVIMPVYNEQFTIIKVIRKILEQEGKPGISTIQLVIVDDGSTDGSREIIRQQAQLHSQIEVVFHEKNQGKTGAIRTGIDHADGEVIVFQDADLEYNPDDYSRLIRPIFEGNADVVFGSRFLVAEYRRVLYFWHSVLNFFLTNLSNILTDLTLTDMETCYKMFRAPLLKSLPIRSEGFGLEPELTSKIAKRNFRIYEVPISYKGRTYEEGKKITWKDGCWAIYYIMKYWLIDDCFKDSGGDVLHSMSLAPRFNRWMADVVRPFLGRKVLEIGAGTGNMTSRFLPRDEYIASEYDKHYLETLHSRFGHEGRAQIRNLDLNEPDHFKDLMETQDSVICLNVLEHIEDDMSALKRMYQTLNPGGNLIILVPQGPELFGSLDRAVGHFRRYTRADLEKKLIEAGFNVERIFDFNKPGVIGWFINGKLFGRTSLGKLPMKIYDHLVWLFKRIDTVLPWRGLSIIAIASKSIPASSEKNGNAHE